MVESRAQSSGRRLRAAMVGGGQGAFIGAVHRLAQRLDGDIELVAGAMHADPEIAVYLRADRTVTWDLVAAVMDMLTQLGIPNVSMRTDFSGD